MSLPYFWDEAGYYIPAARDFFLHGQLVPTSTLTNAHPPLPSMYLAIWWKVFGYAPEVTRVAVLMVASFGVLQVYRIGRALVAWQVGLASAALFAIYPIYFAQSSLANADIFSTAIALWAVALYVEEKVISAALVLALGALAKETEIMVAGAFCGWELATRWIPQFRKADGRLRVAFLATVPFVPLMAWYMFHYGKTGHVFGNAEFYRYNVSSTLSATRFLLAFVQRMWMVLGHMNLFVLTGAAAAAMLLPPLADGGRERERIPVHAQLAMGSVILLVTLFHSLVGGALLARYTMTAVALVILMAVSTLRRRVRLWPYLAVCAGAAFVAGWFVSPPYGFAPEDNLRYADYIQIHQDAARYLLQHDPHGVVLTAWPGADELSKPFLGYVTRPIEVVPLKNFSFEQIAAAREANGYDYALVFSTKQEPTRIFRWGPWEAAKARYFDYHRDVPPELAARTLGGSIVWQEDRNGEWAAIVAVPRARLASAQNKQVISPATW